MGDDTEFQANSLYLPKETSVYYVLKDLEVRRKKDRMQNTYLATQRFS